MKLIVSKLDTGNNTYHTINEALEKANDYDEIVIKSGLYRESLFISRPITLSGDSNVKILMNNTMTDSPIISISEETTISNIDFVSINGLTMSIYGCNDIKIKNCSIISNNGNAVSIMASNFCFTNCIIESYSYALFFSTLFNTQSYITNTIIKSTKDYAIKLTQLANLSIKNSKLISENKNTISLKEDSKIILTDNIIEFPNNKNVIQDYHTKMVNPNLIIN